MSYSWYRTDSAYHRHPKMLALKSELQQPLADAYVSRLWSWTQVYAPDGRFSAELVGALEMELGWTGSAGSLAAALEKTGWLDRVDDHFEVHDWPDFQNFLVKKSRKDADKKRKRRERAAKRRLSTVRADNAETSDRTAPPTDRRDGRTDGRDEGSLAGKPAKEPRQQDLIEKPPDPRHAPLKAKLVEIYSRKKGTSGYPGFGGRQAKTITELLDAKPANHAHDLWPLALASAWERALDAQYPECQTLEEFKKQLPRFMGSGPATAPPKRQSHFAAADQTSTHTAGYLTPK